MSATACWLGLVEGTNPFLSLTFATLRLGMKNHPLLPVYTILLIVSFAALRVVSLPLAYWTLIGDVRNHGLKGEQSLGAAWDIYDDGQEEGTNEKDNYPISIHSNHSLFHCLSFVARMIIINSLVSLS